MVSRLRHARSADAVFQDTPTAVFTGIQQRSNLRDFIPGHTPQSHCSNRRKSEGDIPALEHIKPGSDSEYASELPTGWRLWFTFEAKAYFIDDNTSTSTFHDPRLSRSRLERTWVKQNDPTLRYQHVVTGQCCSHPPKGPGPTARDLLDGWAARLSCDDTQAELWSYVHLATGIRSEKAPASLTQTCLEEVQAAAAFGLCPQYCEPSITDDEHVLYQGSREKTTVHPRAIEKCIADFLLSYEAPGRPRADAMYLTGEGRPMQVPPEGFEPEQEDGIVLIRNVDRVWIRRLMEEFGRPRHPDEPVDTADLLFYAKHIILRQSNQSVAFDEFEQLVRLCWLLYFGYGDGPLPTAHWTVLYDDTARTIHIEELRSFFPSVPANENVVYLSVYGLGLVLLSPYEKHVEMPNTVKLDRATCWIPVFDDPARSVKPDPNEVLLKLFEALAKDNNCLGWRLHRSYERRATSSDNDNVGGGLDRRHNVTITFGESFPWLLASYAWKDIIDFLSTELDYFYTQAVFQPSTKDLVRLFACRKNTQSFQEHLARVRSAVKSSTEQATWVAEKFLDCDDPSRTVKRDLDRLDERLPKLKQEFNDTFQLLIGAISIKDAEVQRELARDSRIQARRATALTALAALYLPLSLTTGVFGMNIWEINQGAPRFGPVLGLGLGLLVVSLPFLWWIFRDKDDGNNNEAESKKAKNDDANHPRTDRSDGEKDDGRHGEGVAVGANDASQRVTGKTRQSLRHRIPFLARDKTDSAKIQDVEP